ncbi:MAG: hypothetical protein RLZZ609_2477 [Cyanobacteriota bacterium]|jgi:proline racemase
MQEPRSHKEMFGVVLTAPTTPDGDHGAINMCGHGVGDVRMDVVFGGNCFALVSASQLGVQLGREHIRALIAAGMAVKDAVNAELSIAHPEWAHIEQVELTKIHAIPDPHQALTKSAVIFGAGQLDRSPCGTGVEHISEGILGARFRGHLEREARRAAGSPGSPRPRFSLGCP